MRQEMYLFKANATKSKDEKKGGEEKKEGGQSAA